MRAFRSGIMETAPAASARASPSLLGSGRHPGGPARQGLFCGPDGRLAGCRSVPLLGRHSSGGAPAHLPIALSAPLRPGGLAGGRFSLVGTVRL